MLSSTLGQHRPSRPFIWVVKDQATVKDFCGGISNTACAKLPVGWFKRKDECNIYILKALVDGKRFAYTDYNGNYSPDALGNLNSTLRHELGHCNGWPGDHPEFRKLSLAESKKLKKPELPESTRWLPAYPPLACITPDRTIEDCKNRKPDPDPWANVIPWKPQASTGSVQP